MYLPFLVQFLCPFMPVYMKTFDWGLQRGMPTYAQIGTIIIAHPPTSRRRHRLLAYNPAPSANRHDPRISRRQSFPLDDAMKCLVHRQARKLCDNVRRPFNPHASSNLEHCQKDYSLGNKTHQLLCFLLVFLCPMIS